MWLNFALVFVAHLVLLIAPGYLLLRSLRFPRVWAVCLGSLGTISCTVLLGELYARVGASSSPATILVPILLVSAILFVVFGRTGFELELPPIKWWVPLIYVGVGMALGYNLYVSQLTSPDAVFQAYDSTQHINLIRAFADSGYFSSLGTNFYLTPDDAAIAPFVGSNFYPAAWHMVCALLVQLTGATVPLVICVSQFVFIAVVYPLASAALLSILFPNEPLLVAVGSVVCLAFVTFPWTFLFFGPIIANLATTALVPALMAVFVFSLSADIPRADRAISLLVFILFSCGVASIHPNGIFTAAALLIPYCAYRLWDTTKQASPEGGVKPALVVVGFLAAVAVCWYGLYRLPVFQPIVWHDWPPFASRFQELVNILTLSYEYNFFSFEHAAQIPLAIVVVVGAVSAAHRAEKRWLLFSYLFACFICYMGATSETTRVLKHIIAGFWYTDPIRLGAMAVIAATPLAAMGCMWVFNQVVDVVSSYNEGHRETNTRKIAAVLLALFVVLTFMPDFNVPGSHYQRIYNKNLDDTPTEEELAEMSEAQRRVETRRDTSFHTPFGDYRTSFERRMAYNSALYENEIAFLDCVKEEVPSDALILNDPMDGSFLAYGFDDLRVYYRNFVSMGWDETTESKLIRADLANIAENEQVRQAVKSIGASYVLLLSHEGGDTSFIDLRDDYDPSRFAGINSITPETPGFELVLSQDDMALYRIA